MKSKTARILSILISVLVLFASCGQLMNDGESTVSINLPYVNNGNSRAISSEDIQRIKGAHAIYRVHINDRVLEGTGGNFSATFPVGVRVDAFIECVNAKGEVILRTVTKSLVVAVGGNNIDFNLKADGTEIIPESQKGRVIYSYGEAENSPGNKSGLPIDGTSYNTDDVFEVKDGNGMTWDHGTFTGWKANVELKGSGGSQDTTTPSAGDSYLMPEGGVTLAAQWQKNQYKIIYNGNAPTDSTGSSATVNGTPAESEVLALSSTAISSDAPSISGQFDGRNWNFKNWATEANGGGSTYNSGQQIAQMTGTITLYAQWTNENVFTVTFLEPAAQKPQTYSNQMPSVPSITEGQSASWTNPSADGWTFDGWEVSDAGVAATTELPANLTSYTPKGNTTLTAKWSRITYTIQYFKPNGSEDTNLTATVNHGDSHSVKFSEMESNLTATQALTGFAESDGGSATFTVGGTATIPSVTRNYKLYAITEAKVFKVRYEPNPPSGATVMYNGAQATTQEVERTYGQSFSWASNMFTAPNGYSFASWNTNANGNGTTLTGTASSDYTTRADEITVYAKWTEKDYTITFAAGSNGSGLQAQQTVKLTTGNELPTKTNTTLQANAGYEFVGWTYNGARYDTLQDLRAAISNGTITATSIMLTAVWQQTGTSITIKRQYIYGMGTGGNPSSWSEFLTGPHTDGSFSGDSKTLVLQDNTQLGYTNLGISETYQNSGTTYTFYGLYPANQVTVDGGAEVVSGMNYTTVNDNGASVKRPTDTLSADMNGQTYYAVYVQGALSDSTRKLIGTWEVSAADDQRLKDDLLGALNGASGAKKIVFNADYTAVVTMYTAATGTVSVQEIPGNQWEYNNGTDLKITMPGSSGSLSATLIVGSDLKTAQVTMVIDSVDKTYTYDKTN